MEKFAVSLFLLVVATTLVACSTTATPTPSPLPPPTPTSSPEPTALPQQTAPPARFAPYQAVPVSIQPNVPTYAFDLQAVGQRNLLIPLSPEARTALGNNGFVVLPAYYEQVYEIYKRVSERGEPAFITTDVALHAFHVLYDYTLRFAEVEHFVTDLQRLDEAMLQDARQQMDTSTGVVREAAQRNVAYFAVALSLLDDSYSPPAPVSGMVGQELALIDRHAGFAQSPIFGYPEDYSQYVPRGHYTRNETLGRYFRAMMWHGRIGFRLQTRDPRDARRETRQAILLSDSLTRVQVGDEPAMDVWDRIYEPTVFFVGRADDLTVHDYVPLIRKLFGPRVQPADLADSGRLDTFIEEARKLRAPRIVSSLVTDRENPEEATQSFRFMGQRFVPDSYVFQQLVYNRVGQYEGKGHPFTLSTSDAGPIRGLPRGLDLLAVLGSPRALEILQKEGDTAYQGYPQQLAKLQKEFVALPDEQWTENLYWNWLNTLRPLLEENKQGFPAFMQNSAWTDKSLHTTLGSWAELRHDTILYAKQSYTMRATSIMPEPEMPRGYVEPEPEVFARLAALAGQMRTGLDQRGLLNDEYRSKLQGAEDLFLALKTMAEKELQNRPLTDDEYRTIDHVGGRLEALTTFSANIQGQVASETDERMAIVADVHTDTNMNRVLEEGVGDAFVIYVIVPLEGRPVLATGGVFSYYEFTQPMDNRLTDEAWQAMQSRPENPAWTASFIMR
ncbi:MAG: DUF3160 domain-containing protein [Chloroflexi bacterium]|nr:DUF3160 domain-containing protein [Chloroflexota bacterium]